jgi:pimeloyl-ACP methyl ester carboxylesterase
MNSSEYTKVYAELKSLFDQDLSEIIIPGSEIRIVNCPFSSVIDDRFVRHDDLGVRENMTFSYPVFVPEDINSGKTILLLHGLNERSWAKYLTWAFRLCHDTGSYVVLFPISFHINRAPSAWVDPRIMLEPVRERKDRYGEIEMSSFVNIALSNRLTDDPMRFFRSGYQTAIDIARLMEQIRSGEQGLIPAGNRVNIFAYSIGAFLAQILMMGNPDGLFSESKLFMFCGGSVFSSMHGTSKLIMDSEAYERIYNFYLNDFEKTIARKNPVSDFLRSSQLGIAFRSMIDLSRFRTFRENILGKLRDQIRSIALLKDSVIPAAGILGTMAGRPGPREQVRIWDFPYEYSHENPFPVSPRISFREVDSCFDRVISEASLFLA